VVVVAMHMVDEQEERLIYGYSSHQEEERGCYADQCVTGCLALFLRRWAGLNLYERLLCDAKIEPLEFEPVEAFDREHEISSSRTCVMSPAAITLFSWNSPSVRIALP
jgi:hypothetical protein